MQDSIAVPLRKALAYFLTPVVVVMLGMPVMMFVPHPWDTVVVSGLFGFGVSLGLAITLDQPLRPALRISAPLTALNLAVFQYVYRVHGFLAFLLVAVLVGINTRALSLQARASVCSR